MTTSTEIENIEVSIEHANKAVNKMTSVLALTKNKDFVSVVEKGYFEEEASRLVLLKADPSMQKAEDQEAIIKAIDAVGHFRQYLRTLIQLGRMMEKSLAEDIRTRDEMLAEEIQ
jgi:hypothetical protein